MTTDTLRRAALFMALLLAQGLVLNRIHLFGCATPLLYVYFVAQLPYGYPKGATLLWAFALGLGADMLANTPGVAAASLTLAGALQPYLLQLFLPRDSDPRMAVAVHTLGWTKFLTYAAMLTLAHCMAFFTLEALTFFNALYWLSCVGGSTLVTVTLMLALETFRHGKRRDF